MPDISRITLPSGTTYDIKDTVARQAAASGVAKIIATDASTTPKDVVWKKGTTTITGTLVASDQTTGFYFVLSMESASGDEDIYDEYVALLNTTTQTYSWEKLGNTKINIDDLGDLAYKDGASGTFTPSGTVSKPNVTVSPTTEEIFVPSSASGGGSVSAGSVTPGVAPTCTLPQLSMSVSQETLQLSWSAGSFNAGSQTQVTLPTVTMPEFSKKAVMTGASAALASTPQFTGTQGTVNVS